MGALHLTKTPVVVDDWNQPALPVDAGFDESWWAAPVIFDVDAAERPWLVQVHQRTTEVARALLIENPSLPHVYDCPAWTKPTIEIRLLETALGHRREGFATELVTNYPDQTMFALSAFNPFWDSLGWTQYLHPIDPDYKTLYRTL